jgi:hypothetical protein
VGTLVIDMADAEGAIGWRGMGVKEVNTQANPRSATRASMSSEKIFKNYPPKIK